MLSYKNLCCYFLILFIKIDFSLEDKRYLIGSNEYISSFPIKRNWFHSLAYCAYLNATLVDIDCEGKNQEILAIVQDPELLYDRRNFWTSGTNFGNYDGSFYWITTGQLMHYKNFFSGQPDNFGGNENCIEYNQYFGFQWNDLNCFNQAYAICEVKKNNLVEIQTTLPITSTEKPFFGDDLIDNRFGRDNSSTKSS